ncbi:fungal-specific transcription factor domain-containing protein [Roridomyces roridus]|uniref:Fungal-specific transcription factor domain-containing protein n=1 Tax=Roridomyces roridus TaxID=1738132 RepID=A0AAD7B4J6_9AGAR|nr:fungal-specific transcription factor domain-containing protein [Roridomyces roridus]
MSSSESTRDSDSHAKKKRVTRPCDVCRRKKRRCKCDGETPCGPCLKHDFNCTYQQRPRQRISTATTYVHSLEHRLQEAETLLRSGQADTTTTTPTPSPRSGPGVEVVTQIIRGLSKPYPPAHSDDLTFAEIERSFRSLALDNLNPGDHGFYGKSSNAALVKTAVDLRAGPPVSGHGSSSSSSSSNKTWSVKPWESGLPTPRRSFLFPDCDLTVALIRLYFDKVNVFFPLLHRATFERAFAADTHLREDDDGVGFARTLLLVCALGARYSDDPRVCLQEHLVNSEEYGSTAGWKWFDEVELTRETASRQPTLYDLQCYALAVQFLDRTSSARACWTVVGIGLHVGKDIGAHRAKPRPTGLTAEHELERRAYWTLTLFDSELCGALGRTPAIHAMDVDLDPPARCDDEYWDTGFIQPADKPSMVDFFCSLMSLNRIFAFTHKVLYSSTKIRVMVAMGDDGRWEEKIVMELDSALNSWFDSVPVHLRWDQTCPSDIFLDQSAALYCKYYLVQMLIHRPFIPAIRDTTKLVTTFPSLTICNNAARACIHIVETQQRRRPGNPVVFAQTALFTAGIVLLLNIWAAGAGGSGASRDADLRDVRRCVEVLRTHREYWPSVGASLNTLEQLLKIDRERAPVDIRRKEYDDDPSPFVPRGNPAESLSPGEAEPQVSAARWVPATTDDVAWAKEHLDALEAPARAPKVSTQPQPQTFTALDTALFAGVPSTDGHGLQFPAPLESTSYDAAAFSDIMAIWNEAPTGFEVSDWNSYLRSLDDVLMQGEAQTQTHTAGTM